MLTRDQELNLFLPLIKDPKKENESILFFRNTILAKFILRIAYYLEDKFLDALFTEQEMTIMRDIIEDYHHALDVLIRRDSKINKKSPT